MKILILLSTLLSVTAFAKVEQCETKYMDAYGHSEEVSKEICTLNDFGRKLVRKNTSPAQAAKLSIGEDSIVVDVCEEETELLGYKEEFAIEICKLTYCEKMLVLEGSSTELAAEECRAEDMINTDEEETEVEEEIGEVSVTIE